MDPEATSVYLEYFFVTSHNPDIEETHSHVPYTSVFLPVFYTAVFLIGVSGNLILMSALHFKRGSRRLIDIFIINLAASDFIFVITLPLWVDKEASLGLWRTGSFLCKGSSYMISVNMHCNVTRIKRRRCCRWQGAARTAPGAQPAGDAAAGAEPPRGESFPDP